MEKTKPHGQLFCKELIDVNLVIKSIVLVQFKVVDVVSSKGTLSRLLTRKKRRTVLGQSYCWVRAQVSKLGKEGFSWFLEHCFRKCKYSWLS